MITDGYPTRYVVQYVDNALWAQEVKRVEGYVELVDYDNVLCYQDARNLRQARAIRRSLERSERGTTVSIRERVNIREVEHSDEYVGGKEWDWDEQLVED